MQHIGRTVQVFDVLDSTNARALAMAADPANDGLAIFADEQTAGRGQHGRTWQAPPRSSVLLSVLVFPPPELRRPVVLTAWAAVSVCEVIQQVTGQTAQIKWPNDVLLGGKKVGGILIEQRTSGRQLATVAGIGLNVNQPAEFFAAAQLPLGGSLAERTGQDLQRDEIARQLLATLDREYARLLAGDSATLEACWKRRLGLLGKAVTMEMHGVAPRVRGRLLDATFAGLELEGEKGERTLWLPEKIKHLTAQDEQGSSEPRTE